MPYSGGYITDSEDELPVIPLLGAKIAVVPTPRVSQVLFGPSTTAYESSKRSLRPRKAFQLRPYAYDRALYGDYFKNIRASSLDDVQDADFDFSDSEDTSIPRPPHNDQAHNDQGQKTPEGNHQLARRRVIDSDSEEITSSSEISESDREDSHDHKFKFYKRLFNDVVPASKPKQETESALISMELDEDSQSQSQSQPRYRDDSSQFSSSLDIPEDRRIDYMLSHASGSIKRVKRKKMVSLVSIVRHMGDSAPDYMRVAARTCNSNGSRKDGPNGKFFALHDGGEEKKTLARWKRGFRGTPKFRIPKQLQTALFISEKSFPKKGSSAHVDKMSSNKRSNPVRTLPTVAVAGAPRSKVSTLSMDHKKASPGPKSRIKENRNKKKYNGFNAISQTMFRTPIIEIPAGFAAGGRKHPPLHSGAAPEVRSLGNKAATLHGTQISRDYHEFAPMFKLNFMRDTFVGSNTLELIHNVGVWNGEANCAPFGTHILSATGTSLRTDFKDLERIVSGAVGEIDDVLFTKVYAFLLETTAGLFRQDFIIDTEIRRLVLVESTRCFCSSLQTHMEGITNVIKVQFAIAMFTLVVSEQMSLQDPLYLELFERTKNDYVAFLLDRLAVMSHQALVTRRDLHPQDQVGPELVILESGVLFDLMFKKKTVYFSRWCKMPERLWSFLSAIAAFQHIRGISESHWGLLLTFLTPDYLQKQSDHKTLLRRILKLITTWKWPVSAEVVFVFFEYFAKEQRYTDSRGESVDLPAFLWAGNFDGTAGHKSEHHYFLELLGLTLSRVDRGQSARIAGRVTPLTSLSFPETQSISASDLSAVSLQYGILLVLSRFAHPSVRPQLIQISDLVNLSHAHVAIRIKAWSAWNILVRMYILLGQDLGECVTWAENMIKDAHSQYKELRKSGHNQPIERIEELFLEIYTYFAHLVKWRPQARVLITGSILYPLPDMPAEVRSIIWEILESLTVKQLVPVVNGVVQAFTPLSEQWEISNWVSIAALLWPLPVCKEWRVNSSEFEVWSQLILRVGPDVFWIQKLIEGLSLPFTSQPFQYINAFKQIYSWYSDTTSLVTFLYSTNAQYFADLWLNNLRILYKDFSETDSKVYRGYVAEVRRAIFEKFPVLEDKHRWFEDSEEYNSIEISQRLLLNVLNKHDKSSFEFFIAYKLRSSLEQSDRGSTFSNEILMSLSLVDDETAEKAFNFLVNDIFAFYIFCAGKTHTIEGVIPLLLSIVYTLVGRCDRALFKPYRFLSMIDRYFELQLARITFNSYLSASVAGTYRLAVLCLRQAFVDRSIPTVLILLRHRALNFLERSKDHSKTFPVQNLTIPEFSQDLATVNILSDLDITLPPVLEQSGSQEAELYLKVYELAQSKASDY
ncbi:hypothetical protein B9G98_02323 [Wickerhamiella sorbophila]|uniref:Methyl methanesulfonate-sensitivity protein 22 n=1 Tax=Wickerhamiella sorbophila TaxID=45607 RepID=A0A2T0FI73_9ASCO|nr:hypothetical protein B9G98_02323 [Wickerhamiella sorbophila]PRT54703.1 hypothetical protein B9G98_02323 [Wickerhamiella sorbophila]